ncbi:phage portal protein [Roseiconus lacunae]|uniref:phage portal protein n=1 Tax=Roseiconus lacunae TaxID=2605694 RepID=UPI0011F135C4|nr:phage portal protein [Roseiconus lacunae]
MSQTFKSQIVDQHGQNFRITVRSEREYQSLVANKHPTLQALYDVASDGGRNEEHWKMADGLSARAANSPSVRKRIRERARYEYANNGYAKGLAWTLSNDLIGSEVRVQFKSGESDLDRLLERRLMKWMRVTNLARKLRTGRVMRSVDGESMFLRQYSPRLKNKVKTSVRLCECDYFDDPMGREEENYTGGVHIDPLDGEPSRYTMMRTHPGDTFYADLATDTIDADDLFHWGRFERGDQVRFVSEMCQSLSLYAQARRLSLASLTAAETAAAIAAYFETQSMPLGEDGIPDYDNDFEALESMPIEHGTILGVPRGHKVSQIKAEQPTTTYPDFKGSIIDEAGRGQVAPSNISRGSAAGYNYSSVRADNQPYWSMQKTERFDLGNEGLDKIASWYFRDARLVYPEFRSIDPDDLPDHVWYFDGQPHIDEQKHADSLVTLVDAELMTKNEALLERGRDPEAHWDDIRQQRRRDAELDKIRIRTPSPRPSSDKQRQSSDDDSDSDQ